jgi:small-conductance mechanosensitive channel
LSLGTLIYLGVVVAAGLFAVTRVLLLLSSSASRRKQHLQGKRWLDAIRTDSPVEDPVATARVRGLANIEHSTTVNRRVAVPAILLLTAVLAAIPFIDRVPAAILSVVVGAVTVFVGFAARPIVENAFAGLVIAYSRNFNIGDTVLIEDDRYGTVEDITVTHTTIRLWDWRRYVIPNHLMMQKPVFNYSLHDTYQWAYVELWVAYGTDLELVRELAIDAAQASKHFADHEDPTFWIMEMGEHGIQCWIAAWADTASSAWALKCEIRRHLLAAFTKHGIAPHTYRLDMLDKPAAA